MTSDDKTTRAILWVGSAFIIFILFASLWRLESVPPLWWDEGWTLSIARNWLERGQYVRLLEGQAAAPGLGASPFLTTLVSFFFYLFGIGIVPARMVGVVFTFLALALVYLLARRLYNRSIALGALAVLTCLPAHIELFPPYMGRQVLAELPAMSCLLVGYAAILSLANRRCLALSIAIAAWSIALSIKLQVLPFWACSTAFVVVVSMYRRDWIVAWRWGGALLGSFLGSRLLTYFLGLLLRSETDLAEPITGLYQVTAAVISIPSRLFALIVTVSFAIPTVAGLYYGIRKSSASKTAPWKEVDQVRAALLFLAVCWFGWFVLLSVGWIRYLFPVTFIGSIFLAAMIADLTRSFDLDFTIRQCRALLNGDGFNRQGFGALFIVLVILTSVPRTALALYQSYLLDGDTSVQQAAEFVNSQTRATALIETYDSELFFYLKRRYHYPPDQIHVRLIRRTFLYEDNTVIDYDPLAADPDYLIVGPHSRQWRLYDNILASGTFRLLRNYPRYQIYQRIR